MRIGAGQNVYLPLEHIAQAVFKTRKKDAVLRAGDELLVQIEKEPMKGKLPRAAVNLHFPGRYMVLTTAEHSLCFSRKLSGAEKQRLRAVFPQKDMDYGVIVRTNARELRPGSWRQNLGSFPAYSGVSADRGLPGPVFHASGSPSPLGAGTEPHTLCGA